MNTQIHPKVAMAGMGGAFATILLWALDQFGHVQVPVEVGAAMASVLAFVAGYLTSGPQGGGEAPKP